ncbi:DNA/RNA helicase domain-containing protein [Cellulomonas sp. RIT-PI-Y]|uniref:DNA/RNA helicase domain-containing protein n=1 Tax=Cellulomonas sp. RIT-PI-Y TaxID=3035297 RepID=UPI0021D9B337|nr:DNA/RNA helicase domain-containing protein [Cellulomonas sp. RIT-PI-Y]
MTSSDITEFPFRSKALAGLGDQTTHLNWPVVYALTGGKRIYIGETLHLVTRMRQHLRTKEDLRLTRGRVVVRDRFNKSACLDLESHLIQWFAAQQGFTVLNENNGIVDADYFDRDSYRASFPAIFEQLLSSIDPELRRAYPGDATDLVGALENTALYKLSPYKALNRDQAIAVENILEGLDLDLRAGRPSTSVVEGEPGTGKTVLAVFLIKLLRDLGAPPAAGVREPDSPFADFFADGFREVFGQLRRIGFVVPQKSLRSSVERVFAKTPGLDKGMVLSPWEVGEATEPFDLLIVDETHRLSRRANQASAALNAKFPAINTTLWGSDDPDRTQLDWLLARSTHQIFLVDVAQRIRPADLPAPRLRALADQARHDRRWYRLTSQMRMSVDHDYVGYIRGLLDPTGADVPRPRRFPSYDLRFFDDVEVMRSAIRARDDEVGLARMVAGYAWPWRTKGAPADSQAAGYDIEIGDFRMRWNSTTDDWVTRRCARDEVGSVHTVQGYDLNYTGVIIGPDLSFDPVRGRLTFDRAAYSDRKGMENNPLLGLRFDDDELLEFVTNIYAVLMTRGMRGTYVYVCDPALREHLRHFFP